MIEMNESVEHAPFGVHKDFHVLTADMIQYLEDNFGRDELMSFLRRVAQTVYIPLVDQIRARGLDAIIDHTTRTFSAEGGIFEYEKCDNTLEIRLKRCPAVWHLKSKGQVLPESFCEQTRVVMQEVCGQAGCDFDIKFDTERGTCVQTFRIG
jgi:predicted ArsR family transcriptional regulator